MTCIPFPGDDDDDEEEDDDDDDDDDDAAVDVATSDQVINKDGRNWLGERKLARVN